MQKKLIDHNFLLRVFLYITIAIGMLCAIYQYFYNRSLWLDEASLALNIIDRSFAELLQPLDYIQVAPIGFLMVEKMMVYIFGRQEFVFRLFPLLCFLASIPLYYLGVKNITKDKLFALIATAVFSTTLSLIYYASEVKQYAVDVMMSMLFLMLATHEGRSVGSRVLFLAFVGSIMIWFSKIAVILLFVLSTSLLWKEVYLKRLYIFIIPPFFWAISFLVYYLLFVHHHPSTEHMQEFWRAFFMPFIPWSPEFYRFFVQANVNIFGHLLGFRGFWLLPLFISLVGFLMLIKKKMYGFLYLCIAPILVHLLLSGLKMYPFTGRLILYLLPFIILLYSAGCYFVFELFSRRVYKFSHLLLIAPLLPMFYPLMFKFPVEKEEIKKSLVIIESKIQPDEHVYVYNASSRALLYYQKTGFTKLKEELIYGSIHREENTSYQQELLKLSGKNWLLFSHIYTSTTGVSEEKYMVDFLVRNGARIIDTWHFSRSSCYYIDTGKNSVTAE